MFTISWYFIGLINFSYLLIYYLSYIFFLLIHSIAPIEIVNPCQPSPCGPNSQCKEINGYSMCSCLSGYIGTPPTCRPECSVDSDCNPNKACTNQKCRDPCLGTCGESAQCTTISHRPYCKCPPGFTGNAFLRCYVLQQCKTNYYILIILISIYVYHLYSTARASSKSMCTITLWTEFSMSSSWKFTIVLMCTYLYWFTAKLST